MKGRYLFIEMPPFFFLLVIFILQPPSPDPRVRGNLIENADTTVKFYNAKYAMYAKGDDLRVHRVLRVIYL